MAGLSGCMPNVCEEFGSRIQAIEFLLEIHDRARGLRKDLTDSGFSTRCPGNEYCSVYLKDKE